MNPHPTRLARRHAAWLLLAVLTTIAAYWVGLQGPFLLDDDMNFAVIQRWQAGQVTFAEVLFGNTTGSFGRPVSMATLALSAWLGGYQPFAFKLGNLVVHLLCGLVIYRLVAAMARRDSDLCNSAEAVAALIAALWLLHPLQASTVLYAVQRMAQMSTLFVLLGLWLYMALRGRLLDQGADRNALIGLFLGIPLLLVAGALAKENALVLPALCLVLELGYFSDRPRPHTVKAFFGIYLVLPFLLGLIWFAMHPARLMGGYLRRDFSWQERLLTQARALCDYLWQTLAPAPSRMGVYTDDFTVSTGWLTPPTTLVAILALLGISVAAWQLRRRIPGLLVGWGMFLVGHAIESSFLPLEMYFEHRNYLPMLGVLFALVSLAVATGNVLRKHGLNPGRIGVTLGLCVVALLAIATHGRARVWSSDQLIAEAGIEAHPESMRAQMALIRVALRDNDIPRARQRLLILTRSTRPRIRAQGHLILINVDCATRRAANPADLTAAVANAPTRITQDEQETFGLLYGNTAGGCKGVTDAALGQAAEAFLDHAQTQPDWLSEKASLAHVGAQFHARSGNWPRAHGLALRAWQPGMSAATAAILVRSQLATGDLAGAERTYREAASRINPGDQDDVAGMRWLRKLIDAAAGSNPQLSAPVR